MKYSRPHKFDDELFETDTNKKSVSKYKIDYM
jgi:hypothetical protein